MKMNQKVQDNQKKIYQEKNHHQLENDFKECKVEWKQN